MTASVPPVRPRADPLDGVRLADLGESGVLRHVFPRLPLGSGTLLGPGDDAAVVAAPDRRVVLTTDVMVEGRDFRTDWSSPTDVGAKAAGQNFADVAAMGAVPTALLVSLVAPPDLDAGWVLGLADGLAEACAGTSAGVVGGDLSSGTQIMVAVTAMGDLQGREPARRDGARPGDVVALAGVLGWSAAGLALLAAGADGADGDERWLAAHRRPRPPFEVGPAAVDGGATAMLDLSDGLARDGGRVAAASGASLDLDPELLADDVAALADVAGRCAADPLTWVLAGGEDHGLLATFPPGGVLPSGFRPIGRVTAAGEAGVLLGGRAWTGPTGWDHYR